MAETRRNEAQDPYGNPSGPNLDAAGGPTRNRPATGAREVNSPQAADSGWQAGLGATDFLGLEPDLRGGSEGKVDGGPTESWLFDIEQADASYAAPTAVATANAYTPSALTDADDAEASSDELEPAFASEVEAETETVPPTPARRGPKRLLAVVAVLALCTLGGWYGWQRFGPKPAPEIASNTPAPAKPAPVKNTPQPAKSGAPTEPAQGTPTTAPVAVAQSTDPVEIQAAEPTPIVETPTEPVATTTTEPIAEVAVVKTPDAPLERSTNAPTKSPELPSGSPGPGGGRHATPSDWAGMWLEPSIPSDAIRGPTRLRTLNVGLVRAELVNGEFVEGSLHAVGESRIWLDVKLGRISFDASDVRDLVQIVGSQGQPVALGTQSLAGLPRVEVLLPGGSLTGRVVGRDGDLVTFVTEEGMRMRVEAIDVRPAPNGRSRLIGPAAARKP